MVASYHMNVVLGGRITPVARSVSAITEVGMEQQVELLLVPHRSMDLCTHQLK